MSSKTFPSTGDKPKFDPNAAYEAVQEGPVPKGKKPAFNPNAKFEAVREDQPVVHEPVQQQSQPAFQVQISEPTFKAAPAQTGPTKFDYSGTIAPKITKLQGLQGQAKSAINNINSEIENNQAAKGRVVANGRLREQEKRRQAGIYGPQLEDKLFITDEDLNKVNNEAKTDRSKANEVLSAAMQINPEKQKEITKNLYAIDAFNSAANDANGEERVQKINENMKAIEKGELVYDHHKQLLINPQGFFGSLVSGRNELNRLSDAYDDTKKMQDNGNEAGIINGLNERLKNNNPDEPVNMPSGILGEIGQGIGGMPIKGIIGGAIASAGTTLLGNPEASTSAFHLASAGINANDMYKIGHQNALEQNYAKFKRDNPEMPDYSAFKKAQDLASKQAVADAGSAAAMQYFGGKVGFGAAKQLSKGISGALTQLGDNLGKKAFEAAGIGGIGAGTQAVKNVMAKRAGLNVETSEGVGQAYDSGLLITGAMSMLGLANEYLKPATRNNLISGLGKAPENVVEEGLNRLQQTETLTPEQSENVRNAIKEQRVLEQLIPKDLPETDRLKVGAKIKERSILKQKLETVDEAYHHDIKEKIKKLNEGIINISKGEERGELQQLVAKEIKSDKVDSFAVEVLKHADEGELKKYMKEISEQAHDPNSVEITLKTFGENIVNKAKELYPIEEKSPSIINPEEEGHVEVSEHGEDTKTAAGEENGIKPSKLTGGGVKEAQDIGQYLADNKKNVIVTSGVERALQTASEAAKKFKELTGNKIKVVVNKLLHTWDIGKYDGEPEGSFNEADWVNKPNEKPEGGESFNDFTKRMEQAHDYVKSLPEDNHVITHSKVMRALEALEHTDGKWTDETTDLFLKNKEKPNAIQEPSTSSVLQHTQEGTGIEGGERGGVEPGQQGEVPAGTRSAEEESKSQSEENVANLKVDEAYGLPFIEEPGEEKTGIKNIVSNMTRFERRLPKVEIDKLGTDQEVLQQGKELVDSGKINPVDVVNRIIDTRGGMEPDEAKAMQYYMHQLSQHETNLRERLATATDDVEKASVSQQLQQLSDEVDTATQANIISGKAWSDVGNIRQIVADTGFNASRDLATIKEAYDGKIPPEVQKRLDAAIKDRNDALNKLAKLEAERKNKSVEDAIKKEGAPKNEKKTKEDFKSERTEIKKSISDKLKKGRTGESGLTAVPIPFAKELISISPEIFKLIKSYAEEGIQKTEEVINRLHEALKDEIDGIQKSDIVNLLAGRYRAEGDEVTPLQQRLRDFRTEANLWTKIAEATKMEEDTPTKKQEKNKKLEDLQGRLNEIRKRNREDVKAIKDILQTDVAKEIKKLEIQRKGVESRLSKKKYLNPEQKKTIPVTTEILKEKQRIVNANYKIRNEKRKAFESQKNLYQKGLMWAGRAVRLSILSGYNVLGKLAAAATLGGAGKRIPEQAIGYIYGQVFRGIARKAPIEGMVSAAAEAKFYKEFFNPKTFVKNAWQILKGGESPLSKQFSQGQYEHIPGLYLPTDLHQIIKDPLKRATYEASFRTGLAWAEKNGLDINDDLVVQSIQNAAYKRAQYEIFQESNVLTKKFGEFRSAMEKKGNIGATGKFIADFMIPVSSVPTNIARRLVTTSPAGLIRGGAKVIEAYRKGIENLTPEQADSVMKQLKQGTLGTALWMIGWYGYKSFGGLFSKFNPNKERDQGDLTSDEMSVDGEMIPKPVQHAIPLEIIQFAATARRVYDNYRDNKQASLPESIEKAGLASIGALTEQIPIIETVAHTIGAFNNPYEAKKLEEEVKRRFRPQILKETGIIGDTKDGSGEGAGKHTSTKQTKLSKH